MTERIKTIDQLKQLCKDLRGFNFDKVYKAKIKAINDFFIEEGLDSVVVGLSGGIDSSVVLKLLLDASASFNSPIKKVMGAFMPINNSPGITGQAEAEAHVDLLNKGLYCYSRVYIYKLIDLSFAAVSYHLSMDAKDPWVCGQIDSIVRTPALYGLAAKLQKDGYKSIVAGTTNRDEGAYIGFFGKASDGMVDLQPIADLHKSEVIEFAKYLHVPKCIIDRKPMGDVHDAKVDEDMFGAPYWFLEMYEILLENNATYLINYLTDCDEAKKWALNIEIQHQKNAHKYKVGSPARYVDVIKRTIN